MPLLYLSCAWVTGIFLGAEFNLPLILILSGLIPLSLLFFTRRHRKTIILTCFSLITLFTASVYSHSSLYTITESSLRFHNDRGLTEIRGMIGRDPEVRDQTIHLHLHAREIKLDNKWREIEGTALLILPRYPSHIYKYGDVIQVTGELKTPPQLDDFDYEGYLAHQGIYSTMLYPKIEIEARDKGFKPLGWVYSVREHISQTLAAVLPEPQEAHSVSFAERDPAFDPVVQAR